MAKLNRREFLGSVAGAAAGGIGAAWLASRLAGTCIAAAQSASQPATGPRRLNILLITADDLNFDSLGLTGSKTPDVSPNIDRLAAEGMFFKRAHVTVAVCQPSRETLMTGRYPHRSGATGFYPVRKEVPTLMESLQAAGYMQGILGKVKHLAPPEKFPWDFQHDQAELGMGRSPAIYYKYAREFFGNARQAGKPFFLMANSHDPHRPWAGSYAEKSQNATRGAASMPDAKAGELPKGVYPPASRYYRPDEVAIPGFLPDLPQVRQDVAEYYSSAHRCDETVGAVLRALKESGLEGDTLVMFLSDNGISMPFAKSNCYLASTHTPWIVRWPGKVAPGGVNEEDFISGIDFMPTILQAAGLALPDGMDGRSFMPLLSGGRQDKRDHVFTVYNDTSGKRSYPMRCLQTARFGYIYNAWSDGKAAYVVESSDSPTVKAMRLSAATQKAMAERVELLDHRVPEELYDLQADPDALHNLIADGAHKEQAAKMRQYLLAWMESTADPLLEAYRKQVKQ